MMNMKAVAWGKGFVVAWLLMDSAGVVDDVGARGSVDQLFGSYCGWTRQGVCSEYEGSQGGVGSA